MNMDNYSELVSLLLKVTKEKKVTWAYGSVENSFRLALNSAVFTIQEKGGNPLVSGQEGYSLSMSNGTGRPIVLQEEIPPLAIKENWRELKTLYKEAKDSCTKEEETLMSAIDELKSLE